MTWEFEKLYFSGDSFFTDVVHAIEGSQHFVHLEYYIWHEGVLSRRLLAAMNSAIQRGVEVRLVVDGVGSSYLSDRYLGRIKSHGVDVKVYHPLPRLLDFGRRFIKKLLFINRRDHRKICVVDERIAFVGGMNVDDCHLEEVMGSRAWRDTGVQVRSPEIANLVAALDSARVDINEMVRLNNRRKMRRKFNRDLVWRIRNAKTRVWLTSPYFSPPTRLLLALGESAKKGADVRLLLPARPDHFLSRLINGLFYPYLLASGVKIYEYTKTTLHAKSRIIDSFITVGTSNKNYRSFFYDLEIDIVLLKKESEQLLVDQFNLDLRESRLISLNYWEARPWLHRLVEKLLWLMRRWV